MADPIQFNSNYYTQQDPPITEACNGRSFPHNYVTGATSEVSFRMHLVSSAVDGIVKASFREEEGSDTSYHQDFLQAYDPTIEKTSNVGFVDGYSTNPKYLIKQLNSLGQVVATGHCLRFVAGNDNTNSDAYIKVTSAGPFVATGSDAGVLYQQDTTSAFSTSWGSSIKKIWSLDNVYQFQLPPDSPNNSVDDSNEDALDIPFNYGDIPGTGVRTFVKIRKVDLTSTNTTGSIVAEGYIFALKTRETQDPAAFPYVHLTTIYSPIPHINTTRQWDASSYQGNDVYILEAVEPDGFNNPCFRYKIFAAYRFDVAEFSNTFKRVEFKENGNAYTDIKVTLTNPTVFQYNWRNIDPITGSATKVEAIPYAFVQDESALYVDECDTNSPLLREFGPIYQLQSSTYVAWGNRSFTADSRFDEQKRGRFINIIHASDNLYSGQDYAANWGPSLGETLVQNLSTVLGYDTNYNYTPGEKIFQIRSSADYDYSSATVVSWSYPKPGTKAPMVLVARIDKVGPAQPANYIDVNDFEQLQPFKVGGLPVDPVGDFVYSGKIVPQSRLSLTDDVADDWPYQVTGSNVFFSDRKTGNTKDASGNQTFYKQDENPLPITVGTTRIRNVSIGPNGQIGEDPNLFKYHLFDTRLIEEDSVFGDVTSVVYDDETGVNAAKTIVDIAPISGRKEVREIFSETNQTITTRRTIMFEPSKDKLFFRIPTGSVFEDVLSNQTVTVELQKIFTHRFDNPSTNELAWTVGGIDDSFLLAGENENWFAVNSDTGLNFNLVPLATGNDPNPIYAENQLQFRADTSNGLTIYAPAELATMPGTNITLFAKTKKTFSSSNVRKKILKTTTETITGLVKNDKNEFHMQLMGDYFTDPKRGMANSVISVYSLGNDDKIRPGSSNLISCFLLDKGITDQKISRPKLILGSGYVKSGGTEIDSITFGTVNPNEVTLKITYDYYELDEVTPNISTRESFVKASNPSEIVSNLEIPFYVSQNNGEIIHESAIIDFRPNSINLTDDFFMDGKITPHIDWADEIKTTYYLPRRDKLILTKDGKFEILYGKPSLSPKYPSDVPNSMSLYLLEKDPFVFGPSNIKTKMIDNRRYTMRDIGKIEKRVQKLEYYTTLSVLEKKAEDMLVLDANGNNRFKNGILVDTFEGHKVGDVTNRDYNIAIDFNNRYARPPFKTYSTSFVKRPDGATTFTGIASQKNGPLEDIFMFPFTETVFVAQPLATRAITVQPHDTIQYEGIMEIMPSMDNWVSTTRRPDVNVNLAGENDAWELMVSAFNNNNLAPFGTQWEEWETLSRTGSRTLIDSDTVSTVIQGWTNVGGGRRERTIQNTTTNTFLVDELLEQVRNGINRTLSTSTSDISLGDRVVDVRLIPYMRQKNIKIAVRGLKPSTRIYVFFDGVNVEEYCYKYDSMSSLFNLNLPSPSDKVPFPGTELLEGASSGVHFATGATADLKTNITGNIFIEFRMPDGMFRVGDRKFEVTSDPRNNKERASTYASAIYSASGLRTEMEETIATTRNFQINDTIVDPETRTTNNTGVFTESNSQIVVERRRNDPLAQTFFVDPAEHPEGIFLSSVDIFFAAKPEDSTRLPVQIQIRPVVNGYPDSNRIYPGAKVIKQPSEIQVSENASVKTNFKFEQPVHLPPGEHSLIVKGDTSEYEIYIATLGDFILDSDTKVTNQPYVGVFFTSANASTWSADQNTDMMMVLNKCEFATNTTYNLVLKNEDIQTDNKFELFNINSKFFDFNSCRTSWTAQITPSEGGASPNTIFLEPNTNIELNNTFRYGLKDTQVPFGLTISALTTNKDVCPVIDMQCLSLFAVNNIVEDMDSSNNGELEPFVPLVSGNPRARYISRVVTLEDGFESSNMKVVLSVNKPVGTNIQVFAKVQDTESTDDFHSFGYIPLIPNVNNFNTYYTERPDEFREIEFEMPQDTATPFNKFCIKICLYSSRPWNVPKIRDLRAVAVL